MQALEIMFVIMIRLNATIGYFLSPYTYTKGVAAPTVSDQNSEGYKKSLLYPFNFCTYYSRACKK